MRRVLTAGLGLVAAGLMISPLVSAAGANSRAARRTFTLYGFSNGKFFPAPGKPSKHFRAGDEIVINDFLTVTQADEGKYRIIGKDLGVCTVTHRGSKGDARLACDVTAVLQHGTITTQGRLRIRHGRVARSTLVITGGTGRYYAAHGTVVTQQKTKKYNAITFYVR